MIRFLRPLLGKLSRREKTAVALGAGFLVLVLVIRFGLFPFLDERARLKRVLLTGQRNLEDIRRMRTEYEMLQQRFDMSKKRFEQRDRGFTLFSFLDKLAGEVGIKERITYMKPSSTEQKDSPLKLSLVEMKLKDVSLEQISRYLYRIETSKNMMTIRRLSLTRSEDKDGLLNIVLQVETFES